MTGAQRLIVSVMTSLGLAGLVGACSSVYAPADPPDGGAAGDATTGSSDDAASSTGDSATPVDADASDAAPACDPSKQPNEGPCTSAADCCSGACASTHVCRSTCKNAASSSFCAVNVDCCLGLYCSPSSSFKCVSCIAAGAQAEKTNVGVLLVASCCSRNADINTGKCVP